MPSNAEVGLGVVPVGCREKRRIWWTVHESSKAEVSVARIGSMCYLLDDLCCALRDSGCDITRVCRKGGGGEEYFTLDNHIGDTRKMCFGVPFLR